MLRRIFIGIVLNALALYAVAYFIEDLNYQGGLLFFAIGGLIIGVLNTLLKPIMKIVTLPIVFITGGLFLIVINTIILWLTKQIIDIIHVSGISLEIKGFITYLIGGFLLGIINWFLHLLIHNK